MKRILVFSVVAAAFFGQLTTTSCTKTKTIIDTVVSTHTVIDTVITYPIEGLWVGTYTANVNGSVPYELDFSVNPDGTMTYYSKGTGNTEFFASGTWTLTGTTFSFSVTEVVTGDSQSGSATYNKDTGMLTAGTITDAMTGSSGTWSMVKIN